MRRVKRLKTSNVRGACPRSMPIATGLLLESDAQPSAVHRCTGESDHSGRVVGHTEVIAQNGALSYRRLPSSCGHALATIGERISHSHPALTVAGASRVQHHCGTCGDRDATDFFCSALPAHIARPLPHRSSQFSRPAFFCRSFSRALLQANSCVLQLRVFCFPGSALTPSGSLP